MKINTNGIDKDINLQSAVRAHNLISFRPEHQGLRMVNNYTATMQSVAMAIEEEAKDERQQAIAQDLFDDMRKYYKRIYLDWINAKSNCASSAITGGSGFNVARAERMNDREHNKAGVVYAFQDGIKKHVKKKLAKAYTAQEAQSNDIEKMRRKIEASKKLQDDMKKGNAFYRAWKKNPEAPKPESISNELAEEIKVWTPAYSFEKAPFAAYQMQNNLANIKRMEKRLADLEEKAKAAEDIGEKTQKLNGLEIVKNFTDDRLQLLFDGKPPEEVRTVLKSHGFRWSPRAGAWQRKLTKNAIAAMEYYVMKNEAMQQYTG